MPLLRHLRLGREWRLPSYAIAATLLLVVAASSISALPLALSAASASGDTYRWAPVAIGGGGFITGGSSDASGKVHVVRTDVHGAYRWDERRDKWVQLITAQSMPLRYRRQAGAAFGTYEIAVAPSDAQRLYMAAGDKVFRSDDGGAHWTETDANRTFPGPLNANGERRSYGPMLAVHPAQPDFVAFGSPTAGLWYSRDGGTRWTAATNLPLADEIGGERPGVLVWFERTGSPSSALRVWAGVAGKGLFAADMRDMHFKPMGGPHHPRQVAHSRDGSMLVVDSIAQTVSVWRDRTWVSNALQGPPKAKFAGIAADPNSDRVYIIDEGGAAWCSLDGGRRWRSVARKARPGEREPPWLRITNQSYFSTGSIAFDSGKPNRLWFYTGVGPFFADLAEGCSAVDLSSQVRGIEELVANDVVQPSGGTALFAAWDFGIHFKPNLDEFSSTYGPMERMIISAQQLDWSPSDPRFIVTNASDTRVNCCSEDGASVRAGYSMDGGASWTRFESFPQPPGTKAGDPWRMSFGTIAVAANDTSNIIWVPAYNRSPYFTLDRGKSWRRVSLPGERLPFTGSFEGRHLSRESLAADRVLPNTFYLLHSGGGDNAALTGLWRTSDGGATWKRRYVGEVAPESQYAAKLRVVPGHAGHLFFTAAVHHGDSRLRRSHDGGATWQLVPGMERVDDIAFGKAAEEAAYPAIYASGVFQGRYGIWRSIDGAASWQRIAGLPLGRLDRVKVLEGDKDVFGRVYIGFMGSGWLYGEPAACKTDPQTGSCTSVE